MVKILKKCAALACYLLLMSFFLGFQAEKLFDVRQFLLWLLGTGLLLLPSLREKAAGETGKQKLQRVSQCGLHAGVLESLLLCLMTLGQMKDAEKILLQLVPCIRPVLYSVCVWIIFDEPPERKESSGENAERGGFREITASESYTLFQEMGLTKRECEIAVLVCQGMSNGEIAAELCISEATVKKHVSNIFEKLGCNKREQIRLKLFSDRT